MPFKVNTEQNTEDVLGRWFNYINESRSYLERTRANLLANNADDVLRIPVHVEVILNDRFAYLTSIGVDDARLVNFIFTKKPEWTDGTTEAEVLADWQAFKTKLTELQALVEANAGKFVFSLSYTNHNPVIVSDLPVAATNVVVAKIDELLALLP